MNHQKPPAIEGGGDLGVTRCESARLWDHESLNDWLKRFALTNERNESARTYVVHRNSLVVGYYSISAGSVSVEEDPARISKGLARHAIPVILLARLAVDKHEKGASERCSGANRSSGGHRRSSCSSRPRDRPASTNVLRAF
jgi:hypothetical protein